MVGARGSTPEFSGPAFEEAVQRAVDALLPGLTARLTSEIRQGGAGGNGDQPPTIHTWLERVGKQKPRSFSSATTPVDDLITLPRCFKHAKEGTQRMWTLACQGEDSVTLLLFAAVCVPKSRAIDVMRGDTIRLRGEGRNLLDGLKGSNAAARNIEILREKTIMTGKMVTVIRRHRRTKVISTIVLLGLQARHVTGLLELVFTLWFELGIWPGICLKLMVKLGGKGKWER
ncbi:hypothetical protein Tco_0524789 [Tanacetum coccineum]